MEVLTGHKGREAEIIDLFTSTFTASEGEEEGVLIGELVRNLLGGTAPEDLFVFTAEEDGAIIGGIVFSRLRYEQDQRAVFVLAPVAVAPIQQGKGIGQRLLSHGLAALRSAGVDIAMTYGDPNYYRKVGFLPISEADAAAPVPLNHPEGWLAQSLTDRPSDGTAERSLQLCRGVEQSGVLVEPSGMERDDDQRATRPPTVSSLAQASGETAMPSQAHGKPAADPWERMVRGGDVEVRLLDTLFCLDAAAVRPSKMSARLLVFMHNEVRF